MIVDQRGKYWKFLIVFLSLSFIMSSQSMSRIEGQITALQEAIHTVERDISDVNRNIIDAEKRVLDGDNVNFWEPKLSALRQDKVYLLKKEEKLQEEAVVLEKSRLAIIESLSNEFGFFDVDNDDNEQSPRCRNTTWAGDHVALLAGRTNSPKQEGEDVKKVESSPSILTKLETADILNHDPNAVLQGQNRRPHLGNLKGKQIDRVDSFNVFGIGIEEDTDSIPVKQSALSAPDISKIKPSLARNMSNVSLSSETSESEKPLTIGKLLTDFFQASESLLLAQGNSATTKPASRTPSSDSLASPLRRAKKSQENMLRPGIQPAESTHDFSVFGADMYNDNDDDNRDDA